MPRHVKFSGEDLGFVSVCRWCTSVLVCNAEEKKRYDEQWKTSVLIWQFSNLSLLEFERNEKCI